MNEDGSPTTLIGLLDSLIEPAEPAPVSMMPQTWGWVVVALVLAAMLAYAGWRLLVRYRANAYRRAALDAVRQANGNPAAIASIVRRTALAAYPRSNVAALDGEKWLTFLDRQAEGGAFSSSPAFASAPYVAGDLGEADYTLLAERWIKKHRSEPR